MDRESFPELTSDVYVSLPAFLLFIPPSPVRSDEAENAKN